MTTTTEPSVPTAPVERPVGTWTLTWHGVRTVAALELRQRVRSSRWKAALIVWFSVVGVITLLAGGVLTIFDSSGTTTEYAGAVLFVVVSALLLGLGLLVTPTLTSTSVNGDRAAGTLATLQVTLLSPAEIAAGKLLAAWVSACAFLVVSLPFLLIGLGMGGVPLATLPRVVLLIALLLAAVCGIGLGWSTLAARPAGSTVLTFVTVAGLTVFTPIFFGLTYPFLSSMQDVQVYGVPDDYWDQVDGETDVPLTPACELTVQERSVAHTEWTWWLLAINPFGVVADGALPPAAHDPDSPAAGVARTVQGLRDLRLGAPEIHDECWIEEDTSAVVPTDRGAGPVWPFGLGVNLLLGAGGFAVAVRRLRTPQRTLPRGTRVA